MADLRAGEFQTIAGLVKFRIFDLLNKRYFYILKSPNFLTKKKVFYYEQRNRNEHSSTKSRN